MGSTRNRQSRDGTGNNGVFTPQARSDHCPRVVITPRVVDRGCPGMARRDDPAPPVTAGPLLQQVVTSRLESDVNSLVARTLGPLVLTDDGTG